MLVFWRAVTGVGSSVQYAGRELFLADISHVGTRGRTLGAVSVRRHEPMIWSNAPACARLAADPVQILDQAYVLRSATEHSMQVSLRRPLVPTV